MNLLSSCEPFSLNASVIPLVSHCILPNILVKPNYCELGFYKLNND